MFNPRAIGILTALVIVEALQLLCMVAHVYSYIPIIVKGPALAGLEPERESFFYMVFLSTTFVLGLGAAFIFKRLDDEVLLKKCWKFLWIEVMWLVLMLFTFFKWITYQYPFYNILSLENNRWVYPFFYGVVALSLLSKIFWPEVDKVTKKLFQAWQHAVLPKQFTWLVYGGFFAVVLIGLYPNVEMSTSIIAQWSNFSEWRAFGLTNFLISRGFSAQQIVLFLFYINVILIIGIFVITKRLCQNLWLSVLVVVVVIRMTLFHYGMSPLCWNYPQNTLINVWGDFGFYKDPTHLPMFAALRVRQFFSFFMGYALVIFYVFTLLNAWGKHRIATILSIYGLLIYTRYIGHANVFAYGAVCWPAVILSAWWLHACTQKFFKAQARFIYAACVLLAVLALLTSRVWVTYPHFWMSHG